MCVKNSGQVLNITEERFLIEIARRRKNSKVNNRDIYEKISHVSGEGYSRKDF